jgi:hypothetical protein
MTLPVLNPIYPNNREKIERWKNLQNNTFTLIQFFEFDSQFQIEEKSIVLDQNGNKIEDEDIIRDLSSCASYADW